MTYETEHPYQAYDPSFNPDEVMMRLSQLQHRIASTISEVQRVDGVVTENYSEISQTVDEINLEVGSKVAQSDFTGANMISQINLAPTTIKISTAHLDVEGFVTFTSLATPGATLIDGGNILTDNLIAKYLHTVGTSTETEIGDGYFVHRSLSTPNKILIQGGFIDAYGYDDKHITYSPYGISYSNPSYPSSDWDLNSAGNGDEVVLRCDAGIALSGNGGITLTGDTSINGSLSVSGQAVATQQWVLTNAAVAKLG